MPSDLATLYGTQYFEAVHLIEQGQWEECVERAECNPRDPTLSRYWRCKYLILICSMIDDWYKAERCRRKAERIW